MGNRARLATWAAGIPVTTTYANLIAGQVQILRASSGSNTTTYLYGLSQIGEFGLQSAYYLIDGYGSIRQLADQNGNVVLTRLYEPFGEILAQKGSGEATYGYLGVQFDRVTGLLYINGRYYDPVTGRFLTPNNSQSPYAPVSGNPLGAVLGSVIVVAMIARRRCVNGRGNWWIITLIALVGIGIGLAACGPGPSPSPGPTYTLFVSRGPTATPEPIPLATPTPPPQSPLLPTAPPCPTPTLTPTPSSTPQWLEGEFTITHYTFALESDPEYADDPKVSANGLPPDKKYRWGFLYGPAGILLQGTGLAQDGNYITIDWLNGGPQGENTYFTYGIGGRYGQPVAWQTVAAGNPNLPPGTRIIIEVYPDKVFTVADTGEAIGPSNIDIFVGAITLAETYQLGTYTSRVAIVP